MTTLTDLSQLTKSMVKKPVEEPKPAPKPTTEEPTADREDAEVLAYFARPGGNAPRRAHVASRADPAKDRAVELEAALEYPPGRRPAAKRAATRGAKDAALDALAEEKAAADERIADLERQLEAEREAHEAVVRERDRLQGECGRLQGELRKTAENAPVAAPAQAAHVAQAGPTKPTRGLLAANGAIVEAFPGEVREQVLAALADALAAAQQSGRELLRGTPRLSRHYLFTNFSGERLDYRAIRRQKPPCGLRRPGLGNWRDLRRSGHRPIVGGLAQFTLKPPALALQAVALAHRRRVCFALLRQPSFEIVDPPVSRRLLLGEGVQGGVLRLQRGFKLDNPILGGFVTGRDVRPLWRVTAGAGEVRQHLGGLAVSGRFLRLGLGRGLRLLNGLLHHRLGELRKIGERHHASHFTSPSRSTS